MSLDMLAVHPDDLVLVDVVASRLCVPVSWVYAKAEAGELPSYRIGRYRRFSLREIDAYVAARREGPR